MMELRNFFFWTCSAFYFGISRCAEHAHFSFVKHPQNTIAVEGTSVRLECQGSNPDFQISWTLNGVPIIDSSRKYQAGADVIIRRVHRDLDEGTYTCVATSPDGDLKQSSAPALLSVHWIREKAEVQLVSPDSKEKISTGHEVILKCHADGFPDVKVEWYRNGERLSKSEKVAIKGKKLQLKSANPNDNGVYRCDAINSAGLVHSEANFVLRLTGTKWAEIQTLPLDKTAVAGSDVMMDCQYKHFDVQEWYFKDTGPLTNSTSHTLHQNGSLLIHKMDASKEGLYSCVGIRADSTEPSQTFSAQLSLAYLDPLTASSIEPPLDSPHHIVPEHSHTVFHCVAPRGRPTPKVSWLGPHNTSLPGHDGRLTIKDASISRHAGGYTCLVENPAGTERMGFTLIVTAPPLITAHPLSLTVDEGARAVLRCGVSAAPYPATLVRWRKGDTLLPLDSSHAVTHVTNGTLVIHGVEFGDRGDYACVVNTTGQTEVVSRPATLQVKEKLKFSPKPGAKKLELGSNDKIHCKAKGAEQPLVKWGKINNYGDVTSLLPSHMEDINGTLHINGVTMQDKGKYVCTATNSFTSINVTIDVDVVISPKFIVIPEDPIESFEGYPIMINCAAEGLPQPNLQWDKNANMNDFDKSRFEVLRNGSLYISEVHQGDEGRYGCTAGNIKGFKRVETTLVVRTTEGFAPHSPEDVASSLPRTMAITLSIAAAYLLLVFGLMAWCRARRRKRKQIYLTQEATDAGNVEAAGPTAATHFRDTIEMRVKDADGTETAQSASSSQSKRSGYDRFAFDRRNLSNMMLLGSGEFGDVFLVQAKGLVGSDPQASTVLMAKSLVHSKDDEALTEFKRQIDLFSKLAHAHVVKMIGLCRDGDPHYLLLEYTDWGDLKQFLLATRKDFKDKSSGGGPAKPKVRSLSTSQAIRMAYQAACGLEHLSERRLIHKDVAARNCVISSDLSVKISLSGLSKDTYQKEYYKYRNAILPLRWLPYEAVFDDEFSTKSDVHAYGILVWEIFNKGELPYPDLSDDQVLSQLECRKLCVKHSSRTPEAITSLHQTCTHSSPTERVTFSTIVTRLRDVMSNLNS